MINMIATNFVWECEQWNVNEKEKQRNPNLQREKES